MLSSTVRFRCSGLKGKLSDLVAKPTDPEDLSLNKFGVFVWSLQVRITISKGQGGFIAVGVEHWLGFYWTHLTLAL